MIIDKLKTSIVALALGLGFTASALPKITASIDSTAIEMGSVTVITLDIADADRKGRLIDLPTDEARTDVFDFVSVEADTFPAGFQYRIKIQGFIPGDLTLDPFRYVVGADTFASSHLSLKILPVDLDSLETINPMKSVANEGRRWYDYIPDYIVWILLGLALLAVIVTLIVLYKKNGTIIVRRQQPVDPYEEAMRQLRTLRDRRLAESGQEKEFYTRLVDILRTYLERRFSINAMEMSSTQILDSLRQNPETRNNQPKIRQILEVADFVKFANIRPMSDDNVKTYNNVVQFVEDTRPTPTPNEEEEEEKSKSTKAQS